MFEIVGVVLSQNSPSVPPPLVVGACEVFHNGSVACVRLGFVQPAQFVWL